MQVVNASQVYATDASGRLFTGPVTRQALLTGEGHDRFIVHQIHFARGVRNKFHVHSRDQVLIVTSGKGICATETEERVVLPGDVVLFPAGEKHWHGAAADSDFAHIYVTGADSRTTQIED